MSIIPIQNLIIDDDTDIGLSADLIIGSFKTTSLTDLSKNVYTSIFDLSGNLNSYGYAGHIYFDPITKVPLNDINYGAPKEIYFTTSSYPTTNLFNAYYSDYMAEITDKDSKLLTCNVMLNTLDILNLDFSKYIWIDGVLFRLNSVDSYNPMEFITTRVQLLKVINTEY